MKNEYIEWRDGNGEVRYIPTTLCTFTVNKSNKRITRFSSFVLGGRPAIPPTAIPTQGPKARLGYFTNNGHFNPITADRPFSQSGGDNGGGGNEGGGDSDDGGGP